MSPGAVGKDFEAALARLLAEPRDSHLELKRFFWDHAMKNSLRRMSALVETFMRETIIAHAGPKDTLGGRR